MTIELKEVELNEPVSTGSTVQDVVEDVIEMEQISDSLESLLNRIDSLDSLSMALESFDTHTPTTAALTQITSDMIRQGTDLGQEDVVPGLESIGSTSVSLEGVKDTLKKAGMRLLEFITSLWTRFVTWINNFFDQTGRLQKKLIKLKEAVKKAGANPTKETITLTPAVVKFLTVGKEKPTNKTIRDSLGVLNEANAYSNGIVRGLLAGWEKSSTSFQSIIDQWSGVDLITDANFKNSKVYSHVDNIIHNLAAVYTNAVGIKKDAPNGHPLPGGKLLKIDVVDIANDNPSYAQTIIGGEIRAKVNLLRLYSSMDISVVTDPIASEFPGSIELPSLSKNELLSFLDGLDSLLHHLSTFRKEYMKKLNGVSSDMRKKVTGFSKLFNAYSSARHAENAMNDPRTNRGLTALVRILAFNTLMGYSNKLTKYPATLMTLSMRTAISGLTYASKCAKALGVVTEEAPDDNESSVTVPVMALPNPA